MFSLQWMVLLVNFGWGSCSLNIFVSLVLYSLERALVYGKCHFRARSPSFHGKIILVAKKFMRCSRKGTTQGWFRNFNNPGSQETSFDMATNRSPKERRVNLRISCEALGLLLLLLLMMIMYLHALGVREFFFSNFLFSPLCTLLLFVSIALCFSCLSQREGRLLCRQGGMLMGTKWTFPPAIVALQWWIFLFSFFPLPPFSLNSLSSSPQGGSWNYCFVFQLERGWYGGRGKGKQG